MNGYMWNTFQGGPLLILLCLHHSWKDAFPGVKVTVTGGGNVEEHRCIKDVWNIACRSAGSNRWGESMWFLVHVIGPIRVNPLMRR